MTVLAPLVFLFIFFGGGAEIRAASPPMVEEPESRLLAHTCSACHALKIEGVCVAGDCDHADIVTKETGAREWGRFLPWVRDILDCPMTPAEIRDLARYLNRRFPPLETHTPLSWEWVYTLPNAWNVVSLSALDGYLYAGVEGKNGEIHRSKDGRNWRRVAETGGIAVYGITKFKGAFYAGGNEPEALILTSFDGKAWKEAARIPDQQGILSLGIFRERLYAGTTQGGIYRSEDGIHWERVAEFPTRGEPNWVRGLIPFRAKFYAVAEQGDLLRTEDGQTWKPIQWLPEGVKEPRRLRPAVVFRDELYIGTISHGEIWKSRDGDRWEPVFDVTPEKPKGYVGSLKVMGDRLYAGISVGFGSGKVYRTSDGKSWEPTGLLSPHTIEALESFKGSIYAGVLWPPDTRIFRGVESHSSSR